MAKPPRRTPRVPRTALYEQVVPVVLVVLALVLIAVVLAVLLWPAPYGG